MARKILFVFLLSLIASSLLAKRIGRVDDDSNGDGQDVASGFLDKIRDNGPGADMPEAGEEIETQTIKITLWRQGFTVDDGELRSYDEEENKNFLRCLEEGLVRILKNQLNSM